MTMVKAFLEDSARSPTEIQPRCLFLGGFSVAYIDKFHYVTVALQETIYLKLMWWVKKASYYKK